MDMYREREMGLEGREDREGERKDKEREREREGEGREDREGRGGRGKGWEREREWGEGEREYKCLYRIYHWFYLFGYSTMPHLTEEVEVYHCPPSWIAVHISLQYEPLPYHSGTRITVEPVSR